MIANIPPYVKKVAEENSNEDAGLRGRVAVYFWWIRSNENISKPTWQPPYSASLIRYAVITSLIVCSSVFDTPQTIPTSFIFMVEQDLQRWSWLYYGIEKFTPYFLLEWNLREGSETRHMWSKHRRK